MHFRTRSIRWLLTTAVLGCLYLSGHGTLLLYIMRDMGNVSVFQPSSAEQVSRDAAPYQANTKETDGMFRIVQRQHSEMGLMYSRLQTAESMNWSLLHIGTAASALLAVVLGICLAILPRAGNTEHAPPA
jgi:hypothetical protein